MMLYLRKQLGSVAPFKMVARVFAMSLLCGAAAGVPAQAAENMDAIIARLKTGDYSVVKSELMPLAEKGDARAQFNLGISYAMGNGVERDAAKAFAWTLKSAENGEPRAAVNLGSMYLEGKGVAADAGSARKWYEKAAEKGDVNANLTLGKIYRDGNGTKVSYETALKYFTVAANAGSDEAKYNLAGFYHYGLGVKRDPEKAQQIFASLSGKAKGGDMPALPAQPVAAVAR